MSARQAIPRGAWLMVAALWGLFLVGMFHFDKLKLFQTVPYVYFTGAAGVALVVLAIKGVVWPSPAVCGCGHAHGEGEACGDGDGGAEGSAAAAGRGIWPMAKGIALVALVMLPVLAGVLIPHRSLNAFAAIKRGMGLDSSELLNVYRSRRRQWAQTAGEYVRATPLDVLEIGRDKPGLKVRMVGFVVRSEEAPADILMVVRFKITCCAADATPVAVAARWAKAGAFTSDTWVEVRGRVERQMIQGREVTVIVADEVREVAQPDQPYI